MNHSFRTSFGSVALRPLTRQDALKLRALRNRNSKFFLTQQQITEEQQLNWFQNYLLRENDYMFAITLRDKPEEFCGAIGIYNLDKRDHTGESGRVIIDKELVLQKGIGTLAICAAYRFAFEQLGLRKVFAQILPDNIASIRAHEKAGYVLSGKKDDCLLYEITAEHYTAALKKEEATYEYSGVSGNL